MARDSINAVITDLGMLPVSFKDRFTISYVGNLLDLQIKRENGVSDSIQFLLQDGAVPFSKWKLFEPKSLSKKERNKLICDFYEQGKTQAELANIFNQSQANISKIIIANSIL